MESKKRSPWQWSPTIIAFLNGVIMSAAINILTGVNDYDPPKKWIALGISITMLLGSILLIVWQNIAEKLQEAYPKWKEEIITNNTYYGKTNASSWSAFIRTIDQVKKNEEQMKNFKYPVYSRCFLNGTLIAIAVLFIISIGTLIYIVI